jgi:hypothetical protein
MVLYHFDGGHADHRIDHRQRDTKLRLDAPSIHGEPAS